LAGCALPRVKNAAASTAMLKELFIEIAVWTLRYLLTF